MTIEVFALIYAVLGLFFTTLEHRSYDWSAMGDGEMPLKLVLLNMGHQLIHYSRFMIVWPFYVVEDILLIISNKLLDNGDE